VLSRLQAFKKGERWEEADTLLGGEFQRLVGMGAEAVATLSETELLARLIQGEPTQVVHTKTLLLTTMLKEAGDVAAARNDVAECRSYYLKGLHLLLDTLARAEPCEFPDFVPRIEAFLAALGPEPLPVSTQARLMQHYELLGDFAKAEDALFAMLETEPNHPGLVDFGLAFYERLRGRSDASLAAGNLSRPEVEAGLRELRDRKRVPAP